MINCWCTCWKRRVDVWLLLRTCALLPVIAVRSTNKSWCLLSKTLHDDSVERPRHILLVAVDPARSPATLLVPWAEVTSVVLNKHDLPTNCDSFARKGSQTLAAVAVSPMLSVAAPTISLLWMQRPDRHAGQVRIESYTFMICVLVSA